MNTKPDLPRAGNDGTEEYLLSISPPKNVKKLTRRISQILSLLIAIPLFYLLAVLGLYYAITPVLVLALVSSTVFGRAFCSWVCPFGTFYEFSRLVLGCERLRTWCRFGCPYAFLMGVMNRFSIARVQRNETRCNHCGICDDVCPVGLTDLGSNYKDFTSNPSLCYACIRCLTCVGSCPQDALRLGYIKHLHGV
jgi:polyferredoxin